MPPSKNILKNPIRLIVVLISIVNIAINAATNPRIKTAANRYLRLNRAMMPTIKTINTATTNAKNNHILLILVYPLQLITTYVVYIISRPT